MSDIESSARRGTGMPPERRAVERSGGRPRRCPGCRRRPWPPRAAAAGARPRGCAPRAMPRSSEGSTGTASWATMGPPSSVSSTRWTVTPVTATRAASASSDGVAAGERRQQRRVDVDDPAPERGQHAPAEDAQEPREHDDIRARPAGGRPRDPCPTTRDRGARMAARTSTGMPCSTAQSSARADPVREHARRCSPRASRAARRPGAPAGCSPAPTPRPRCGAPVASPDLLAIPRRTGRRRPARPRPMSQASCPRSRQQLDDRPATAAGSTTSAMPMPPLNVARISGPSSPASAAMRAITAGTGQRAGLDDRTPRPGPERPWQVARQAAARDVRDTARPRAVAASAVDDRQDVRRRGWSVGVRSASPRVVVTERLDRARCAVLRSVARTSE